MILTNISLADIRIDIPKEKLVKLIRIHLGIDHFVSINHEHRLVVQQTLHRGNETRIIKVVDREATEYEEQAEQVCEFLLLNLKDNLNVKS